MEIFCALLAGIAIVAAWTGGWRAELFGITFSVRSAWRPLLVAVALLAARAFRTRDFRVAEFRDAALRVLAGALLVAGVLGWVTYVSPYLGGADSYGYVSASERLRAGALIETEPLAALVPYPDSTTPLGYVQAPRVPNATAPAYPLGLPALIALATILFGASAPFYVSIAMALVLVATCYWIALRLTADRTTALATAAAAALHPVVFAYAIQTMSDVPATAWYLLAAAVLMTERPSLAPVAGMAGCFALLTRPALLPGVLALALIAAWSGERRLARIATFGAVLPIGVAVQAWLQWYLYGSPLANGYGSTAELFSWRFLIPNIRSYVYWTAIMHGAIWIAGFLSGLLLVRDRAARAMLAAAFAGAVVPYAVYRTYDHWETLRFVLPLLVLMTIFAVAGIFELSHRVTRRRAGAWLGLALTIVMLGTWVRWLEREQVFALARTEERFARAGELVARVTPEEAVILSSLHSGSLRYYTRRQTLDWAKIPHDRFDATVDALERQGHAVFLMLDGQEERQLFETRHGDVIDRQQWLPAGQRRDVRLYEAPSLRTKVGPVEDRPSSSR